MWEVWGPGLLTSTALRGTWYFNGCLVLDCRKAMFG